MQTGGDYKRVEMIDREEDFKWIQERTEQGVELPKSVKVKCTLNEFVTNRADDPQSTCLHLTSVLPILKKLRTS
jgi:hypothetical protein